jgi:Holliday junction resolvasome RuvABC endonuclease subunit
VAVEHGCISTQTADGQYRRLAEIYTDMSAVLANHPGLVYAAVEDFRNQGRNTNIATMQRAIGVLLAAVTLSGAHILETTDGQWRPVIVGRGPAGETRDQRKERTRAEVQRRFGLPALPPTTHEADGLAIAAWLSIHKAIRMRTGGVA